MKYLTLLVTVGSDYHPFDRLIGWVDAWLEGYDGAPLQSVVQYGSAARPRHGEAHKYMPHGQLINWLAEADVVVTQGGPMGIVEARRAGVRPIVVPRLRRLGEVVDDHQVHFSRKLAARGDIVLVESSGELSSALGRATAEPQTLRLPSAAVATEVDRSVDRFGALVSQLAEEPTRRIWSIRPRGMGPYRLRSPVRRSR